MPRRPASWRVTRDRYSRISRDLAAAAGIKPQRPGEYVNTSRARVLSVVLNSGVRVAAKIYKGSASALTYANRTQAAHAACKLGGNVLHPRQGGPFYVAVEEAQP